jgi:lipid kinase YegS
MQEDWISAQPIPEEKRRLFVIAHGKSACDPDLREAVEAVRALGTAVDVRVTWEAGDASRYAKEAVQESYDVVVAAGGDGLLNEVVNGILEADSSPKTAVAVLPMGTANDFATSCGLVDRTPLDALKLAAGGTIFPVDVGRLNGRYFLNVVSGGFGAEVTTNTPVEMKQLLGGAAYSLMGFITALKFRPYEARLIRGEETRSETLLMVAAGNGRQCGGGYQVTPRAVIDDGLLDIVCVREADLTRWAAVYQEMTHPDWEDNEFVDYHQVKSFILETAEPFQMNLDGEPLRATRFEFGICEKILPFVLPAACGLLLESRIAV